MSIERARKPRPYWHVDAKWITGLLLVLVLGLTLLVYNLVDVTNEKPATDTLTMWFALSYSPKGLDDETGIAEMRKRIEASPNKTAQPIPGLRIFVREQDIAGLAPRQARLFFFRQWAEPLYKEGPQGLAALADDPIIKQGILQGAGPFAVLSLATHQALEGLLLVLVIISGVLLVPLIFFSHRFGRLGSPGCVLFVTSLPCAILSGVANLVLRTAPIAVRPTGAVAGEGEGLTQLIGSLVALLVSVVTPLVSIISGNYLLALAMGFGVMALAVFGNLVWGLIWNRQAR